MAEPSELEKMRKAFTAALTALGPENPTPPPVAQAAEQAADHGAPNNGTLQVRKLADGPITLMMARCL